MTVLVTTLYRLKDSGSLITVLGSVNHLIAVGKENVLIFAVRS